MKKYIITLLIFIFTIISLCCALLMPKFIKNTGYENTPPKISTIHTVSYNGWLHTEGNLIKNEKGEIIQLRGLSSHGIEWYGDLITYDNLKELKENWNINVFRIAMYTDTENSGYVHNSEENKQRVENIVDMAINLDMYVIVDWHILTDKTPLKHEEKALEFFNEISKRYANNPNVIYEICNEPNGISVTWENDIKPYAEKVIPVIRKNSDKSLIIVGTPGWCLDIDIPANSPLNIKNVVYACHFYSGSHGKTLQDKIDNCIEKNIPIFVSECGLTNATGNGETFFNEFQEWINFLNERNISWIYWSFSNKDESSAILLPTYSLESSSTQNYEITNNTEISGNDSNNSNTTKNNSESTNINNFLTESGIFIKNILH